MSPSPNPVSATGPRFEPFHDRHRRNPLISGGSPAPSPPKERVVATFGSPSPGANHLRSLPSPVAEVGLTRLSPDQAFSSPLIYRHTTITLSLSGSYFPHSVPQLQGGRLLRPAKGLQGSLHARTQATPRACRIEASRRSPALTHTCDVPMV